MKEQSFDNDVNSLTGMSNSNSGAPSAIDEQAPTDAFERSWDWDYEPQTASFSIEPGMHRAHVDYSNISIPNANNNIAKFTFDLKVEITNRQTGSSSSYVPPETETEPVDNNDEGDDVHAPAVEAAVLPTAVPAIRARMATTAEMRMRLIRTIPFPRMTAWTTGAVPPARLPCAAWFPPPPPMESSLPQANG